MSRFLILPLFSLTALSAMAATPIDRVSRLPDQHPAQIDAVPSYERARSVAFELAFLQAPDPSFGLAVAGVGDLDGDGLDDFAVGAPHQDDGAVYVYRGTGDNVSLWAVLRGDCAGGEFGAAIAGGDTDGDGLSDLVIGAPGCEQVLLVKGSEDDLGASIELLRGEKGERLGASVAMGDADGDGLADLVAGAPDHDEGRGRVWIRLASGAKGPLVTGRAAEGGLGEAVAFVSDLNGDGLPEVAAGAPHAGSGRLTIVVDAAAGEASAQVQHLAGDGAGDQFGRSFAGIGDIDGDGYGELVVGAPMALGGEGALALYHGGPDGVGEVPGSGLARARTTGFGRALAVLDHGVGGDYFVAMSWSESALYGRLSMFHPGGEGVLSAMESPSYAVDAMGYGYAVAGPGDLSGDGLGDLLVSQCFIACQGVSVLAMGIDTDADGAVDSADCAPRDPAISPLAPELDEDGLDQDCDGVDGRRRAGQGAHKGKARVSAAACSSAGAAPSVGLLGLLGLALARRRRAS